MKNNTLLKIWQRLKDLIDVTEYIDVDAAADNIRKNVRFRGPNIIILFCAIIIASVGLNVNSIPVIIGAMLISPLMSPIVGLGMALGTNDTTLLHSSLKNLGIMVGISILASTLYFLVSPLDMEHPTELLARTNPTIYDVLIALFGGFAGIVETSKKEKGTVVVGVAIATALMPPLCTVGYGLACWNPAIFIGATYLFFINLAFIAISAFIGTKYLGYKPIREASAQLQRKSKIIGSVILLILIVPSVISAVSVIQETNFTRNANAFVAANKTLGKSYVYDSKVHPEMKNQQIELFIAGEQLSADEYARLLVSAENFGLTSEQILLHQDAAYTDVSVDENELVRDILNMNNQKLQERAAVISQLQSEVDSLRALIASNILPVEQINAEIRSQYPNIANVMLAQMEDKGIIAVVEPVKGRSVTSKQSQSLERWLAIRLQANTVHVIVR